MQAARTYHDGHRSTLHNSHQHQHERQDFPARFSLLLAPHYNNAISHNGDQLQHSRKTHQEAYAPPHGAEIPIGASTVLLLWKVLARIRQAIFGAASVQPYGFCNMAAYLCSNVVRNPIWNEDGSEGHRRRCGKLLAAILSKKMHT
jgi:hypothetical protein